MFISELNHNRVLHNYDFQFYDSSSLSFKYNIYLEKFICNILINYLTTPLSKNGSIIAKLFKFNIDVFLLFLLTTIAYELGLHTL